MDAPDRPPTSAELVDRQRVRAADLRAAIADAAARRFGTGGLVSGPDANARGWRAVPCEQPDKEIYP